jgi:hypothetical protein
MRTFTRTLSLTALLLAPSAPLFAQAAVDPSGHWTGAIHVPAFNGASPREVGIDIDLARNGKGELAGTFAQPAQSIKGLPLSKVSVDGKTVTFELKASSGGGIFRGTVAGPAMTGEFITTEGGYAVPFDLARTGDAKFEAAPKNAAIGKEFEGTWNGTIEFDGKKERLILKLANQPDGSAAGTILDLDGTNMEIPIGMTQNGAKLTIQIASANAVYSATLNGDELSGTLAQGGLTLPLVMKRAAK